MSQESTVSEIVLQRLKDRPENAGLKNYHVSFGPNASKYTTEELVEEALKFNEAAEEQQRRWNMRPEQDKLRIYLVEAVRALKKIMKLRQMNFDQWQDMDVLHSRLSEMYGIAEMTLLPMNPTITFSARDVLPSTD